MMLVRGGLITAVAEMCFGGDVGADVWVPYEKRDQADAFLFNETAGTFVVEVENDADIRSVFYGVPHTVIGATKGSKRIRVEQSYYGEGEKLFTATTDELKTAWQAPMKGLFHS